jgi:hypothetical protein
MKLYIFVVLSAIFGVALSASGPECDISSDTATKIDIKSSEEFWKNVDGANKITQLTSKSQQKFLKDNPNAFVMYYTTSNLNDRNICTYKKMQKIINVTKFCLGCPNSQNAKVGFAAAAKDVTNVAFGAVDCNKDPWVRIIYLFAIVLHKL